MSGALDEAVAQVVARTARRHVGLVVGVVTADGERAVAGAGRVRAPDGPPPDGRTLCEVGSVTKVLTGLLLAEAVVRGEVALGTPVGALLPELAGLGRDGVPVTLEHLATHTSGLPRNPVGLLTALRVQWRERDGDPWASVDRDALLRAAAGARLGRTPGTGAAAYSNTGAGLLGHALVAASGSSDYAALLGARVTGPLGLHDTVLLPGPELAAREADGHRRGRPTGHWQVAALPGAGAVRSTAEDLLRLLHACLVPHGTPLEAALVLSQQERRPGRRLGSGLGWVRLSRSGPGALLWHDGGTGGFRAFVGLLPEAGVAVAALANDRRSVSRTGMSLLRDVAGGRGAMLADRDP